MRNLFYIGCSLMLLTTACKKSGEVDHINPNASFPSPAKVSSDNIVLSADNDNDSVLTVSWPEVTYNSAPAITYTLELDFPSDTASGWANAQKFTIGNVLSYSFLGKNLNNTLLTLNDTTPTTLVFRIVSNVNQYNGSTSAVPVVYSSAASATITPYKPVLYVPGSYQGWDPAAAPVLNFVPGYAGVFEGYVYISGTGAQSFKYTNTPDSLHVKYGDGGGGAMSTAANAPAFSVSTPGYYELAADLNGNTWTARAVTWGIIGDATPGSWDTDTQLTYDPVNQVWSTTVALLKNGSFKFRANNQWVVDFGIDNSGNLQYADNPLFTYNPNLNNLSVPADGTYVVTLDLHHSQHYSYSVVKQ